MDGPFKRARGQALGARNLNTKASSWALTGVSSSQTRVTASGSVLEGASQVASAFGLSEPTAFSWRSGSAQPGPRQSREGGAKHPKPRAPA